jgi:DNA modification methylase
MTTRRKPKPFYKTELGEIYCNDCFKILHHFEYASLLLTDVPYGLNKKMTGGTWGIKYHNKNYEGSNCNKDTKRRIDNMIKLAEWDYILSEDEMKFILSLKIKNKIIWGGNYYPMPASQCWLGWVKPKLPTLSDLELAWTTFEKPAKYLEHRRLNDSEKIHPTQKPPALINFCLDFSKLNEEDVVVDSFAGSCQVGACCEEKGIRWVCIEKEKEYCLAAIKKIDTATKIRKSKLQNRRK